MDTGLGITIVGLGVAVTFIAALMLRRRRELARWRVAQVVTGSIRSKSRMAVLTLALVFTVSSLAIGAALAGLREHALLVVSAMVVLSCAGVFVIITTRWTHVGEIVLNAAASQLTHRLRGSHDLTVDLSCSWSLVESVSESSVGPIVVVGLRQEDTEVWFHYPYPLTDLRVELPEGRLGTGAVGPDLGPAGRVIHERLHDRVDRSDARA